MVPRFVTPTRLFVAGFLLLQLAWTLTIPPFRGIDEFDHVYRAAAVAGGDYVAETAPDDGRGLLLAVPPDIVAAASAQCSKLRYTGPDNCSPAGPAADGRVLVASGAANYHPAFYWVVGKAGAPFEGAASLYTMRLVSALMCAVFIALATWSATRTPGPWPIVGLGVALTPVLVYSTTVVAPNGLEMSAAIALWTSLLRLRVETDPVVASKLVWVAVASAAAMCTLRLLGPLWVLAILTTVFAFDVGGCWNAVKRQRLRVIAGFFVVAASAANFLAWQILPDRGVAPDDSGDGGFTLLHVPVWMLQAIAAFPYRNQAAPAVTYVVVGLLASGLLLLGIKTLSGTQRWVLIGSFVASVVIPVIATVLTVGDRGVIWQGRYGLPLGVGFVLIAATACAQRRVPLSLPRTAGVVVSGFYFTAIAACLLKIRRDELDDNAASAGDPAWHVPSPALIVAIVLLGIALSAGAARVASRELPVTVGEKSHA